DMDEVLTAHGLRWFDDGNPAHLLAVIQHCERTGCAPPWWLARLLARALHRPLAATDIHDWQRWWWGKVGLAPRQTKWPGRACFEWAAAHCGERIGSAGVRKSYLKVQQAYRTGAARRYPHVLIIENGWRRPRR